MTDIILPKHKPTLHHLGIADIAILTVIFFGVAIISSNYAFMQAYFDVASTSISHAQINHHNQATHGFDFANFGNLSSILWELILLVLAFVYLKWRRFDFHLLNLSIHRHTWLKVLAYFLLAGFVATSFSYLLYFLQNIITTDSIHLPMQTETQLDSTPYNPWAYITPTLIIFALLNGFFEELYFLGLIFATPKKIWHYVLPFSLLVRFSFHTYQGLDAALTITTLGVVYLWLRLKNNELVPFMLAHSIFDVIGLGLPLFLWYN